MNARNLEIIVNNYIQQYDQVLAVDADSTLWKSAYIFKALADAACALDDDFLNKLSLLCESCTAQLDGKFVQPMEGLCDYAKKEPETVRGLLAGLFADDWGNYSIRENKIQTFVEGCNQLRLKYYPWNIRYSMTSGKALSMLALYHPDDNFLYREASARLFAECVGFEEDWGVGSEFNYAVYYKMCLELVDYIKRSQLLIFTSCKRYDGRSGLHDDQEYHILAYDIIRCNARCKLFTGIRFNTRALEDNKAFKKQQTEALVSYQKYRNALEKSLSIRKGRALLASMVIPGMNISHTRMGGGVVELCDGENITITFPDQSSRRFNLLQSVLGGFITFDDERLASWKDQFGAVFSSGGEIQSQVEKAFHELEERIPYLI